MRRMKVCVFGAGYVGLVTAAGLAEMGNSIVCLEIDAQRVAELQAGRIPIHEPGLAELTRRNIDAGRLAFTTDAAAAVAHGTIIFIAVGTPASETGDADLGHVLAAATTIGEHMRDYKVVVDKSTVPVGTASQVRAVLEAELKRRAVVLPFAVVSNPEFLKEGSAVEDFMRPDRIIVGSDDEQATLLMRALYAPFQRNRERLLVMDPRSAELTKYAANAMLATRISFMNEIARVAERLGADIDQVRLGIGADPRIGTHFLYAGCGWGGSCLPKDVKALLRMGGSPTAEALPLLSAVQTVNDRQRLLLVDRIVARFGADLREHVFALWGLAFKPDTDDLRESPAIAMAEALVARGARVKAYDPVAMPGFQRRYGQLAGVELVASATAATEGADALLLATEWREFRTPDFAQIARSLKRPLVFDGRNLYEPQLLRDFGFEYHGIGRAAAAPPPAHGEHRPATIAA